jgi:hypothetical protein
MMGEEKAEKTKVNELIGIVAVRASNCDQNASLTLPTSTHLLRNRDRHTLNDSSMYLAMGPENLLVQKHKFLRFCLKSVNFQKRYLSVLVIASHTMSGSPYPRTLSFAIHQLDLTNP